MPLRNVHAMGTSEPARRPACLRITLSFGPPCLAQKKGFAPGVICEHGSLKNNDFRGQFMRGFVSRETAIAYEEEESKTRGAMSSAA